MDEKEKRALEAAQERLGDAEVHQAEARDLQVRADSEVADAKDEIDEIRRQETEDGKVKVHFKDLIERESASFHVNEERTLQEIWNKAYEELDVEKRAKDILQAIHRDGPPSSLMEHLGLTLAMARQTGLCDVRFEIATGTGGA